jgi:DNA-binding GntR family transcriptional regulator
MRHRSDNSVTNRIELELERSIVAGEYPPGARLNENAVAARFGVSRAPVREACRLLERAGLVDIVLHQGPIVRKLSLAEIVDLFDVRACLGRLAGQLAAAAMTRAILDDLRVRIADLDDASRKGDAERYIALNIEFHTVLYAATGNARLAALDEQMGKELRTYRRYGLAFGGGLAVSNLEHRAVLAAVESGDREAAGAEMERHIQNGRDRFIRAMSASGQLVVKDNEVGKTRSRKGSRGTK